MSYPHSSQNLPSLCTPQPTQVIPANGAEAAGNPDSDGTASDDADPDAVGFAGTVADRMVADGVVGGSPGSVSPGTGGGGGAAPSTRPQTSQ